MHPLACRPVDRRAPRFALNSAFAAALVAGSACSTSGGKGDESGSPSPGSRGETIKVVAAENVWGSLAAQLGGSHAKVTSVIDSPQVDPHDYEPTGADARTVASAQLAIVNGAGYDAWAPKLLASNPDPDRKVLDVGDLVGVKEGGNPHLWYSPDKVRRVIEKITAEYKKIDPDNASYFEKRNDAVQEKALASYNQLVAEIRKKYRGTPIGASESIVDPLAKGLGLKMRTPESFLNAISEGADPTAGDKATVDRQIKSKQIMIYVYNSQNSTPDVRAQVDAAKAKGIPVATVTETLTPADASFQEWQVAQLRGIHRALADATKR
ncbi:metal ABC transporter solute-binding protein, Zn/Mn family [Streptomyces sp. 8N114]|uniref:metal ABC transporter solute-binding protein, Zn/Mn family n=1 Tax=Streptomyces sp. 8N114 TaxID=3457419 RepID=UPI003FD4FCC9